MARPPRPHFSRELGVFSFFLLLTVMLTWPLAERLRTATSDLGDPLLVTWIIDWDLYSLTHTPSRLYQATIFYPSKYPLAYSENMLGIAIVCLPFYLLGLAPLVIYNLAVILGFAWSGYGAYVLGRTVTRSMPASVIAGVLYAFIGFRFDHLAHLQFIWGGWLPLMLAALIHYLRRPLRRNAVLYGLCVLMNGLTNVHHFVFGTFTLLLTLAVLAAVSHIDRRTLGMAALATILAAGLMVPVLMPYRTVAQLYGMRRDRNEALDGSATWSDWLYATGRSRAYGRLPGPEKTRSERFLFPGLLMLFLTASAIVLYRREPRSAANESQRPPPPPWLLRSLDVVIVAFGIVTYIGAVSPKFIWQIGGMRIFSISSADIPATVLVIAIFARLVLQFPKAWAHGERRSLRSVISQSAIPIELWIALLWIAVGVVGSLGLHTFFHSVLYDYVDAFQGIRIPARWATIAYVGLIVTSACGAAALIERQLRTMRVVVIALLFVFALNDVWPWLRWEHIVPTIDDAYVWLRDAQFSGGTLEFPVQEGNAVFFYLFGETFHHHDLLNGVSGFEPPLHRRLRELTLQPVIGPELMPLLEQNHCALLLVHDDWLRGQSQAIHNWLQIEQQQQHLAFIRRFDHRVGGDYLFAVTANMPQWRFLLPAEPHDAAGFTPDDNLQRMIHSEPTYLNRTFGMVDQPKFDQEVDKMLNVSGWALSPNGISAVDVLLDSARRRYGATLVDRSDVQAKFPWYPRVQRAGFILTLPKRPKGVSKYTDVQVEITDGTGNRTRLPDLFVTWQ